MADEPTPPAPVEAPSEDVPQAELAGPTPEPSPAPSREEVTAPAEEAPAAAEDAPPAAAAAAGARGGAVDAAPAAADTWLGWGAGLLGAATAAVKAPCRRRRRT